jgi:polyisoprenoid-binding protein YceI
MKRETITIVRVVIFLTVMALFTAAASAEQKLVYGSAEGSTVRVDGTSTAHDWTVTGRQIDGTIEFRVAVPPGASREQIKQALVANPTATASVAIPSRTLKSGKKDMDKKMFDALRAKKHPEISYKLGEVSVVAGGGANGTSFELQTTGELTIAGATRTLDMPMTIEVLDERRLKISGRTAIRMSDYKVERPQAMGGLIKSGDRVVVEMAWVVASAERPTGFAKE